MKTRLLALAFLAVLAAAAHPDVIRMADGSIYLGRIVSAGERGVTIEAFGSSSSLNPRQILRTESGIGSLDQTLVELHLKDGSVIRGTITNYDPDIGLLVGIEFGTLTIPYESLRAVEDPRQREAYRGQSWMVGASGGWYWPVGDYSPSFSSDAWLSLSAAASLPWVRGLCVGIDAAYWLMGYLASTEVEYQLLTAMADVGYRVPFLRATSIPVVKDLEPWASLGFGVAWVGVHDLRPGAFPAAYGELDPVLGCAAGIDWHVGQRFLVRLEGRWAAVLQSTSALHLVGAGIGVGYGR